MNPSGSSRPGHSLGFEHTAAPGRFDTVASTADVISADATLAPGSVGPAQQGAVVIRAGRRDDYGDLVSVDPQHYVVGREIARGGMGRITSARDRRLGREVAIKELLVESAELRARFEREARITARLQHPAIVNLLEAGVWPSGEPFYVMKLVTGESLDKVIASRPTLEARLALLPNVIAAVDALAYAHNMRVIHRDLKPANVLVGEYGETVVIDWGLAKDLGDTSAAPDVTVGPHRTAMQTRDETHAGAILGTPAYMPVEQAEGDAVDERADVYALGAMLYHVLAGAAPYTGRTADAILDAVIAGPPPALEARAPGVPPDLVTIVNKAMAHSAVDRYPTAKELAADLKKLQTGQLVGAHHYSAWQLVRRWIGRHRTAVAVALVAAVLLGVLGVVSLRRIFQEQARTEQQRVAAVLNGADAEDLMDFMVVDMRDKLEPIGKLELLNDVATKAIGYYARKGQHLSGADAQKRALAQQNLGDVLLAQGHSTRALEQYRVSLFSAMLLSASDPANPTYRASHAARHVKVGHALRRHDASAALAEYQAALAIQKTLAANEPTNLEHQAALAMYMRQVGEVLVDRGDAAGALAAFREALVIHGTLAAIAPTNTGWQRALAANHHQIGTLRGTQGDAEGSIASHRTALGLAMKVAAKDPDNAVWQRDLVSSHSKVGDGLRTHGDAAGALAEYRAAFALISRLAAKDPTSSDLRHFMTALHERIGKMLSGQGDAQGALAEYRAAKAIAETSVMNVPTDVSAQEDLASAHERIGSIIVDQQDLAGALVEYRAYLAISERVAKSDPTNANRQRNVTLGRLNVGDVLFAQGDKPGALAAYQPAVTEFALRVTDDPTNVDRLRDLAGAHEKVGDARIASGDLAGAMETYRASVAIHLGVSEKAPTNVPYQAGLAIAHHKLADVLSKRGETTEALAQFQAALDLTRRVQVKYPTHEGVRMAIEQLTAAISALEAKPKAKGTKRPQR